MTTNHHIYIVLLAAMVTVTMTAVCNVKYDILTRGEGCYTDMKSCAIAKGMPSLIHRCDRRCRCRGYENGGSCVKTAGCSSSTPYQCLCSGLYKKGLHKNSLKSTELNKRLQRMIDEHIKQFGKL